MPFDASDAKRHKKGLSESQRKKWARIADSVRRQCLDSGKDESECDAQAIRVANSQVGGSSNGKSGSGNNS